MQKGFSCSYWLQQCGMGTSKILEAGLKIPSSHFPIAQLQLEILTILPRGMLTSYLST